MRKYGLNVIVFQLVTGARRWYIVGCYLAPDDTLTIEGENGDGNGYGNGESGPEGKERGRERKIGEAGASRGGRGAAVKTGDMSVGNVYSYRTAYTWEGAD